MNLIEDLNAGLLVVAAQARQSRFEPKVHVSCFKLQPFELMDFHFCFAEDETQARHFLSWSCSKYMCSPRRVPACIVNSIEALEVQLCRDTGVTQPYVADWVIQSRADFYGCILMIGGSNLGFYCVNQISKFTRLGVCRLLCWRRFAT